MTIVKDGYPFILGSLAVALAVWYGAGIIWCIPFLVLTAYFAYFLQSKTRYGAGHFGNLFSGRRNGNGRGGFLRRRIS